MSHIPDIFKLSEQSPQQVGRDFAIHFGLNPDNFMNAVDEGVNQYQEIERKIAAELGDEYFEQYSGGPGIMPKKELSILYALVRTSTPEMVVETGVAQGSSTALILKALSENNHGHLHSIDLPRFADTTEFDYREGDFPIEGFDAAVIPEGKEPGWLVDNGLEDRWSFHIGRSTDLLYDIVSKNEPDIFIHDSEHSYKNILWELSVTAPELSEGGWMWVDDSDWNDAFAHFSEGVDWPAFNVDRAGVIHSTSEYEDAYTTDM